MTLTSNQLIQNIETLLTICQDTLQSDDALRLQQQHFQFKYVDTNELLMTEITRALSERIGDDTILSHFRMLLRYALVENKQNLGGHITGTTIELLQGPA